MTTNAKTRRLVDRILFLGPASAMLLLFFLIPVIVDVVIAFTDMGRDLRVTRFTTENVVRMLTGDRRLVSVMGTTLVYVSHDLHTVEATCTRGLWLDDGVVKADGPVGLVLDGYRTFFDQVDDYRHPESSLVRLLKVEAQGGNGDGSTRMRSSKSGW